MKEANDYLRSLTVILAATVLPFLTLSSASAGHIEPTDPDDRKFDKLKKQGDEYLRSEQFEKAIYCFSKAADAPHRRSPLHSIDDSVRLMVRKFPYNAEAHAALGVNYMNRLDLRYGADPNEFLGDGKLAEWEFKTALTLSPDHTNKEISELLVRLNALKQKAAEHDSHLRWYEEIKARKSFRDQLLTARWNPPLKDGFFCTRVQKNYFSTNPKITVPSLSEELNDSVVATLRSCVEEFPYLNWGQRDFVFINENGVTTVRDECLGDGVIIDPNLKGKPQLNEDVIAKAFLAKNFSMHRIQQYCKPETQFAFKRDVFSLNECPGVIVSGKFMDYCPEFGGPIQWLCAAESGKPILYELDINYKWRICIDPTNLPQSVDFDAFIVQQRVRDSLFSCIIDFEIKHFSDLKDDVWSSRQPLSEGDDNLVRASNGQIVAYECRLKDGRTVTAKLAKDHSIASISVGGEVDPVWATAYQQIMENQNIDTGCSPVPIVPAR